MCNESREHNMIIYVSQDKYKKESSKTARVPKRER